MSVVGVVLAAGQGKRLRPLTDALPKTLLPVDGETTILDIALRNLGANGVTEAAVVTGHAADAIAARREALAERYGLALTLIENDQPSWNNAYSLWLARDWLARGALVLNGDTVHPAIVEEKMLGARGPGVLLALDEQKDLGEEEMKVILDAQGQLRRIHKAIAPGEADGEYIGVTLIEATAAAGVTDALERTWRGDRDLYYEDGFQAYADAGGEIRMVAIGGVDWVEVDNHDDLARARAVACHY